MNAHLFRITRSIIVVLACCSKLNAAVIDIDGVPAGLTVWITRDGHPDFEELPRWRSETMSYQSKSLPLGNYHVRLGPGTLSFVEECIFDMSIRIKNPKAIYKVKTDLSKTICTIELIGELGFPPNEKGLLVIKGVDEQNKFYCIVRNIPSFSEIRIQALQLPIGRYNVDFYRQRIEHVIGVELNAWSRLQDISAAFIIKKETPTPKLVRGAIFRTRRTRDRLIIRKERVLPALHKAASAIR